jgi:hypothetical protein
MLSGGAMELSLLELEAAINFWRDQRPARGDEVALSPEVKILARIYAMMIYRHLPSLPLDQLDESARRLLQTWRDTHAP